MPETTSNNIFMKNDAVMTEIRNIIKSIEIDIPR